MLKRPVTALICLLTFGFPFPLFSQSPSAQSGTIDLSLFSGRDNWQTDLDGQWEFYWSRLLAPQEFTAEESRPDREFINVPGNWNSVNNYPSEGYATIRLVADGLEENRVYSLYIPEMLTSFRLFVNGRFVYGNGTVGVSEDRNVPQFLPGLISFEGTGGRAEIICQISNFDHRNSGIWRSLSLGTEQKMMKGHQTKLLMEMFIAVVLLTISLFHIGIFIYRHKAGAELLFGLSCLVLFFRTITTGEQLLTQLIPSFPWELARRLEYSPFYAAAPLFMSFISELFPRETIGKINRFFISLFILIGAFFLIFPVRITNRAILTAEIILVLAMLYAISIIIRALMAGRNHSRSIAAAFIILSVAAVNDILFSRQIISTMYLAPQGFIIFIIIQSQMLSRRYALSFREVSDLSLKLKDLNESLSRFVPFQFLEYLKKKSILDVNLGDQVLEDMTILFADIRSFTSLSELMTPEENFRFLNSFLSQVVPVIRQQGGFVDKFIGDAIMALFPFPPDQAVHAALELQSAVNRYNEARDRAGYREISLGIGIHTGLLMLGTIGETNRMETTVIADTVNIASRLEELTKTYGARIIISRELYDRMEKNGDFPSRSLGEATVKGKAKPIEIIEILHRGGSGEDRRKIETLDQFNRAVEYLKEGRHREAEPLFREVISINPEDKAAVFFLELCSSASTSL